MVLEGEPHFSIKEELSEIVDDALLNPNLVQALNNSSSEGVQTQSPGHEYPLENGGPMADQKQQENIGAHLNQALLCDLSDISLLHHQSVQLHEKICKFLTKISSQPSDKKLPANVSKIITKTKNALLFIHRANQSMVELKQEFKSICYAPPKPTPRRSLRQANDMGHPGQATLMDLTNGNVAQEDVVMESGEQIKCAICSMAADESNSLPCPCKTTYHKLCTGMKRFQPSRFSCKSVKTIKVKCSYVKDKELMMKNRPRIAAKK